MMREKTGVTDRAGARPVIGLVLLCLPFTAHAQSVPGAIAGPRWLVVTQSATMPAQELRDAIAPLGGTSVSAYPEVGTFVVAADASFRTAAAAVASVVPDVPLSVVTEGDAPETAARRRYREPTSRSTRSSGVSMRSAPKAHGTPASPAPACASLCSTRTSTSRTRPRAQHTRRRWSPRRRALHGRSDKADRLLCELTGCLADLKRYRDRVTRPSIAKEHVRAAARHDAALAPSMR